MAKVYYTAGIKKIKGRIGDAVFYENAFGNQVKELSGPRKWQVEKSKSYENARRNAREWQGTAKAAQLVRRAAGSMLDGVKNVWVNGRMNKVVCKGVKADPVHGWGERVIGSGTPSVLAGFEFNHLLTLGDALPLNPENCYTVEADKARLNIPAFRLRKKKDLPEKATHYRLLSGMLTIDFDKRTFQRDIQTSPLMAMGRKAGEAFSAEHAVSSLSPDSFWLLGIEFYRMENDQPVLVKHGAMRIMQWWGPERSAGVQEDIGVAEPAVQEQALVVTMPVIKTEQPVQKEPDTVMALPEVPGTAPTPSQGVQYNYVSSGQSGDHVVYQFGQQGWYGTSWT